MNQYDEIEIANIERALISRLKALSLSGVPASDRATTKLALR